MNNLCYHQSTTRSEMSRVSRHSSKNRSPKKSASSTNATTTYRHTRCATMPIIEAMPQQGLMDILRSRLDDEQEQYMESGSPDVQIQSGLASGSAPWDCNTTYTRLDRLEASIESLCNASEHIIEVTRMADVSERIFEISQSVREMKQALESRWATIDEKEKERQGDALADAELIAAQSARLRTEQQEMRKKQKDLDEKMKKVKQTEDKLTAKEVKLQKMEKQLLALMENAERKQLNRERDLLNRERKQLKEKATKVNAREKQLNQRYGNSNAYEASNARGGGNARGYNGNFGADNGYNGDHGGQGGYNDNSGGYNGNGDGSNGNDDYDYSDDSDADSDSLNSISQQEKPRDNTPPPSENGDGRRLSGRRGSVDMRSMKRNSLPVPTSKKQRRSVRFFK